MDLRSFATWNPVEDEWTIHVPARANLHARADSADVGGSATECPFCPGSNEIPEDYDVRILPSRFPIVGPHNPYESMTYGAHDVFLYTSDHRGRLVDQSAARIASVLTAIAQRTAEMLADRQIRSVYAFEVSGDHFGPTVAHPHGQIVGFPFVPRRLIAVREPCQFCAAHEEPANVVVRNLHSLAVVPTYARFPYEMAIVPLRHVARLDELSGRELRDHATTLASSLRACLSDDDKMPPYLLSVMQGPRDDRARHHLRIELMPLHRPQGGLKRPVCSSALQPPCSNMTTGPNDRERSLTAFSTRPRKGAIIAGCNSVSDGT